jgi:hypothetical protein
MPTPTVAPIPAADSPTRWRGWSEVGTSWESCEMGAARLLKAARPPPLSAPCVAVGGRPPPQTSAGRAAAPRQRPPGRPRGRGGCDRVRAHERHPHIGRPLARHARGLDAPAAGALMVAAGARQAGGRRRAGGRAWAAAAGAPRRGPAEQRPRHPVRPRGSGPVIAALTAGLLELNASVKDASQGQPDTSRPDPDPHPHPHPSPRTARARGRGRGSGRDRGPAATVSARTVEARNTIPHTRTTPAAAAAPAHHHHHHPSPLLPIKRPACRTATCRGPAPPCEVGPPRQRPP